MQLSRLWPLALLACLGLTGCETPCPTQPSGCASGMTLQVLLPDQEPQVYELDLTFEIADEVQTDRCLLVLPLPKDWQGSGPVSCQKGSTIIVARDVTVDCTYGYPEGASCSTKAGQQVLTLRPAGQVDAVELQLVQGATTHAPLRVEAVYERQYPDGPSCPGSCEQATAVVQLAALLEPLTD